jgi:hypothetical protein
MMADVVNEHFIAATVNQLYNVQRDGQGGKFLASLGRREANFFQVVTPTGKLVDGAYLAPNGGPRDWLKKALEKWKTLPDADRHPAHVELGDTKEPAGAPPKAPPGTLIVKTYTRSMKRNTNSELAPIAVADLADTAKYPDWGWAPIFTEPMPDVMWLKDAEWKSLIPKSPRKGDTFTFPNGIEKRILRFHLIDGTYGLPFNWKLQDIRKESLTFTVEEVDPVLRLRVQGLALLATDSGLSEVKGQHGYDAKLLGYLEYDSGKQAFTRFDIVAVGDCWGGDWEGGRFARPGRAPLGIAFELARGDSAADFVPPKGQNYSDEQLRSHYFAADRP